MLNTEIAINIGPSATRAHKGTTTLFKPIHQTHFRPNFFMFRMTYSNVINTSINGGSLFRLLCVTTHLKH
jgi:hypothetical protein